MAATVDTTLMKSARTPPPAFPARHGARLRGLDDVAGSSMDRGRFGRMFRWLPAARHTPEALEALAVSMIKTDDRGTPIDEAEPEDENPTIDAGYTYLGQFIDHDITFDPVSSLTKQNDPDALTDFRTPRLDLDSLYGAGPADQPYLYSRADTRKLLVGADRSPGGLPGSHAVRPDLPRNPEGVALLGDPRNDENRIVSQLHALMQGFHNRVVDEPGVETFEKAQRLVRWHYQWIVKHEYLPRIVGSETVLAVAPRGRAEPDLRFFRPRSNSAYMPVEFSVAAFRFGHSQIRPSYSLSEAVLSAGGAPRVPVFSTGSGPTQNLNGFQPLAPGWGIDWRFFFGGFGQRPTPQRQVPQPSYRIDTLLVEPLGNLPGGTVATPVAAKTTSSLAFRNLLRGRSLGLPSGQDVARAMGLLPLTDAQLWGSDDADVKKERSRVLKAHPEFRGTAPLWFYVLREAELTRRKGAKDPETSLGGHHLGPVGGRIVAEVLLGLLWFDHHSFLYQAPAWTPTLPAAKKGHFSMADLVRFTDS